MRSVRLATLVLLICAACGGDPSSGDDTAIDASADDVDAANPAVDAPTAIDAAPPVLGGCTTDADCGAGGMCDTEAETGFPGGQCVIACTGSGDCPSGSTCLDWGDGSMRCLATCDAAADCGAGYSCFDFGLPVGVCWPDCTADAQCTGTGACNEYLGWCSGDRGLAPDGAACAADADCESGLCYDESGTGFPDGYCSSYCDPGATGACPAGGMCFDYDDGNSADGTFGVCYDTCAGPADCRAGYACYDFGDVGVCWAQCESDAECPDSGVCNVWTGWCEPVGTGATTGQPCDADADCESGWCATEAEYGFPGGRCASYCDPSSGFCGGDAVCIDASDGSGPVFGFCLDGCAAPGDCRAGLMCIEYDANTGYCEARCESDAECPDTGVCDEESGYCEAPSGAAPLGAACATNADCESGWCWSESGVGAPEGQCKSICDPTSGFCPGDGVCSDWSGPSPGVFGACHDGCTTATDCRAGYMCASNFDGTAVCWPRCESNAECPDTMTCNLYSGWCEATGTLGAVGAPCATGADCESGWCWNESDSGNPDGFCAAACDPTSGFCPDGGACQDWQAGAPGGYGSCTDACTTTADCRAGYGCWFGQCYPDCDQDAECPDTGQCNEWSGLCEPTVGALDGAPCTQDSQCRSGVCWAYDAQQGYPPGGYCISWCTASQNNCPIDTQDGVRSNCWPDGGGTDSGVCYDGCTADGHCRTGEGYACWSYPEGNFCF